jgi:hypothetical protein
MQEEYNSLLKNQTWDLVPLPLEGNLSGADGSIGPRAQQMDILADTKPGLFPKAFSRCMALTMMRPSL